MAPYGSSVLSFILIALGMLGVILSFLVPDRKKSLISLSMAGFIIIVGIFQLVSQSWSRYTWNRKMAEIQRDRQGDLDELRARLKEKAAQMTPPAADTKKK